MIMYRFTRQLVVLFTVVGLAGLLGCSSSTEPTTPPPDTQMPGLFNAYSLDRTTVEVVFNEEVRRVDAETAASYYLTPGGSPTPSINVSAAVLKPNGKTVVLTTDEMDPFSIYDVYALNIRDIAGNEAAMVQKAVEIRMKSGRIYTYAGNGVPGLGAENIDPLESELYLPQDLTFGPDGLPYILDWNNHKVRTIENGLIRTVLGTGLLGDAQPGFGLDVSLNHPTHISFDPQGRLVMAAWHNSKILRMDMTTSWVETICGNGQRSYGGEGGPAEDAILNLPSSCVHDSQGRWYISDQANQRVRMVDLNGVITTFAGNGTRGSCGDGGPAVDACLNLPSGQSATPGGRVALDSFDNLYLADTRNYKIRKVDTNGIITTFAGTGGVGASGDGGPAVDAQLNDPRDVAVAPDGTVYIADTKNHAIRVVDTNGILTTFAGILKSPGFSGDGGKPEEAQLFEPFGIALDADGNLYIADTKNHRLRVVYK